MCHCKFSMQGNVAYRQGFLIIHMMLHAWSCSFAHACSATAGMLGRLIPLQFGEGVPVPWAWMLPRPEGCGCTLLREEPAPVSAPCRCLAALPPTLSCKQTLYFRV